MIRKVLILAAIFYFAFAMCELNAQETINTAGAEITGNGGSVNYSIGQVVNLTYTGSNGSVSSGVQQPYEISVINELDNPFQITLKCNIYPNPTSNLVILNIENIDSKNMSYMLFDREGKFIKQQKIFSNETSVDMSNLISSIYFLKVSDGLQGIKTFKIIKK
ncbi:MAG: hypothetical protein C0597_07415 [Marinilabiliales bacterium]|nr:MAG: hypothetical protein C0597_07415 [Marinilabiliales bacterium]